MINSETIPKYPEKISFSAIRGEKLDEKRS
jgi:hypothetical protein